MQKILYIEPMQTRNEVLNAKFIGKLHNSLDETIPATVIWRDSLSNQSKTPTSNSVKKNPLWPKLERRNHVLEPLNTAGPEIARKPALRNKVKDKYVLEVMKNLPGRVAESIALDSKKLRHICQRGAIKTRRFRTTIIRWTVGAVCQHQQCKNCQGASELSRKHGEQCAKADIFLQRLYPEDLNGLMNSDSEETCITNLLNRYKYRPPGPYFYDHIFEAINMVLTCCREIDVEESGYWKRRNVDSDDWTGAQQLELVAPVTGGVRDPVRTQRRRELAQRRNRQVGRPWMPTPEFDWGSLGVE